MPVLTATFLAGALLDLPVALIASPAIPPLAQVTPTAWIALAVLTLFITPVNLACQNLAMRRLDASQVANFSNISPILTRRLGGLAVRRADHGQPGRRRYRHPGRRLLDRPEPLAAVPGGRDAPDSFRTSPARLAAHVRQGPAGARRIDGGRVRWTGKTATRAVEPVGGLSWARADESRAGSPCHDCERGATRMSRDGRDGGVAVYVTSHGFGHLNRTAAVVNRIPRGIPVSIRSHASLFDHWRQRVKRPIELGDVRVGLRGGQSAGRQQHDRRAGHASSWRSGSVPRRWPAWTRKWTG